MGLFLFFAIHAWGKRHDLQVRDFAMDLSFQSIFKSAYVDFSWPLQVKNELDAEIRERERTEHLSDR